MSKSTTGDRRSPANGSSTARTTASTPSLPTDVRSSYRAIPLPEEADADHAQAHFEDGVLEITILIPKRVQQKARRFSTRRWTLDAGKQTSRVSCLHSG